MIIKPFQPKPAGAFLVANAVAASAPAALDDTCAQVVLYNSSATATAFWICQNLSLSTDTGPTAVVPTTAQSPAVGATPIPPGQRVRLGVGFGPKKFSVIADTANGNLIITPGNGD